MRILADENMPDRTVELLRMAGHDVLFAKEMMPSESDPNILAAATSQSRLLATQDKDFGDIVVNRNQPAPHGVVLFRLHSDIPDADRVRLMAAILNARNSWGPGIWAVSVRHPLTRTQFVIARSVATWRSRCRRDVRYPNEIATLRSQ